MAKTPPLSCGSSGQFSWLHSYEVEEEPAAGPPAPVLLPETTAEACGAMVDLGLLPAAVCRPFFSLPFIDLPPHFSMLFLDLPLPLFTASR